MSFDEEQDLERRLADYGSTLRLALDPFDNEAPDVARLPDRRPRFENRYLLAAAAAVVVLVAVSAFQLSRQRSTGIEANLADVPEITSSGEDEERSSDAIVDSDSSGRDRMLDVPVVTVEGIEVHEDIADAVEALLAAAEADGVSLSGGGYRPVSFQIELRRENCGQSDYDIWERPPAECDPPTALPGTTTHEKGLAIDFTCDGALINDRNDRCFVWLAENAAAFGLANLPSEPWHWSVNGR